MNKIEEAKKLLLGPVGFRIKFSLMKGEYSLFREERGILFSAHTEKEAISKFYKVFKNKEYKTLIESVEMEI